MSSILESLACENCQRAENQFVHDSRTDDTICRYCGVVVRNFNYRVERGKRAIVASCYNSNLRGFYHAPQVSKNESPEHKQEKTAHSHMMDRVFRDEATEKRNIAKLRHYVDQLGEDDRVFSRTLLLLKKYPKMFRNKGTDQMIVAAIVIVRNSIGRHANIKEMEEILGIEKISKSIGRFCKHTGISQRSLVTRSIPYIRTFLGLEFRDERQIRELFLGNTRKNGSLGSYTVLALTLFEYMGRDKSNVDSIAFVTNTSKVSLMNYIEGRKESKIL